MSFYLYFLFYFIFTVFVFWRYELRPHSIINFFVLFSFIGYGIQSLILYHWPQYSFVASLTSGINYEEVIPYYPSAFLTFLLGYVAFITGFLLFRNRKLGLPAVEASPDTFYLLFFAFLVSNWGSFQFRSHFKAGVVGFPEATAKFANYAYYSFNYLALILLCVLFFKALRSQKRMYLIAAVFSGINYSAAILLLGWKSGIIYTVVMFIHILLVFKGLNSKKKQLRYGYLASFILLFVIISYLSFSFIPAYRSAYLTEEKKISFEGIANLAANTILNPEDLKKPASSIFNRIRGINALVAIVSSEKQLKDRPVSMFDNIFTRNSYQPETYFGTDILKMRGVNVKTGVHTEAPTGWGVFYIYYGNLGVIFGFLVFGVLSALFENTLIHLIKQSYDYIGLYSIWYAIIFSSVIFEGTVFFFLKRHFGSLLLVFVLYKLFLFSVEKLRKRVVPGQFREL